MRFSISSLALALVSSGLLALSPMHASAASSTFDSDLEGWEAVGFDIDFAIFPPAFNIALVENTGDMVHEAADGNPGGYARLTDAIEEPASFAAAPVSFLNGGDLTSFIGGTFSFDHRLFDTGTPNEGIAPYTVFFLSGDPTDLNAVVWTAPPPAGATDWVHFDITVDESELTLFENVPLSVVDPSLPSSTPADLGFSGTMTFEEIMGSVDEILVAFELVDNVGFQNQEHGGIDNVQLLPEPGSLALLLLSGVILLRRRR
jgi:hypothetical protein